MKLLRLIALLSVSVVLLADEPIAKTGISAEITKPPQHFEPSIADLKAEIEQLKQRQQITDARCKALAEFYQADVALRQLEAAPKIPTHTNQESK